MGELNELTGPKLEDKRINKGPKLEEKRFNKGPKLENKQINTQYY